MRYTIPFLAAVLLVGTLATGCTTNMERKLGRGITNTLEPVRMSEWRRSMEQAGLFNAPDTGYASGFVRGVSRSAARTGIGIYEVVTFPFPSYDPIATDYLAPGPVYPDNYKPQLVSDPLYATDTNLGFSGGDVLPISPGSRFRIFDTH